MTGVLIRKGNLDRHTQRAADMKTQREDGRLQAKERGLRRIQPVETLILDFQNCEKIHFCLRTLLWQLEQTYNVIHVFKQRCISDNLVLFLRTGLPSHQTEAFPTGKGE